MKIAILSFRSASQKVTPEELRLARSARSLGHVSRIFRTDQSQLYYDGRHPRVLYQGKIFPKYDVIIPRPIVLHDVDLLVSIIKQFQLMKLPVVNGYLPVARAKNKLRTLQILNYEGIPVPKTIVVRDVQFLEDAVKRIGGTPLIMKTPFGSYGHGVVLVETKRSLKSAWDFIQAASSAGIVLIQEYIRESKGKDIRVFVIGGKVIGAMQRKARRGDFRSNLEQGGQSNEIQIDNEIKNMAIKAVKALGLQIAGVDVIMSKNGPAVMEVNSNPGFKGFEAATGIDVAAKIIQYSVHYAKRYKAKFGNGNRLGSKG